MKIKNINFDLFNERKTLFFIFIISLVIRLLYIYFIPTTLFSDQWGYDALAVGVSEGRGYGPIAFVSSACMDYSFMPPGYSFFLAIIYRIFGHNILIAKIFQAFIGSFTCIIIYFIGKNIFDKKIGILSALVAAFYPTFIIFSGLLFTETLYIFLLSLAILYLLKDFARPSIKNLLIIGVSLGLAMLTRTIIMFFIPFILIWMILYSSSKSVSEKPSSSESYPDAKQKKKNLMRFLVLLIIIACVISPWTVRNYNVHHDFVPISTNNGFNFWYGNNPEPRSSRVAFEDITNNPLINMTDEVQRDRLGYKEGFKFIKDNPRTFLFLCGERFCDFLGLPIWFFIFYEYNYFIIPISKLSFMVLAPLTIIPYILLIPLSIFGIIFHSKGAKTSLLLLLIFYYTFVHTIVMSTHRYHIAIIPFLIIFATYGACSINKVRHEIELGNLKTRRKLKLFFVLVLLLILVWYYWSLDYVDEILNLIKDLRM